MTRVSDEAPSDRGLVVRSRREPEVFAALFDRHFGDVHRYVAQRIGDAADDAAAEVFCEAFRQRDRYDESRGDPRAWLFGIATNLIRRHRRTEARMLRAFARLPIGAETPHSAPGDGEDAVLARITARRLRGPLAAGLRKLSPGDRDVLLLVALGGLTYDEVAAALGIAYGTVCSRLSRARRRLRSSLRETYGHHWEVTDG